MKSQLDHIQKAPIVSLLSEVSLSEDVISFGQGIPFFKPPREAVEAVKESMFHAYGYQYSQDTGWLSLRTIIANKIKDEQNVIVDPKKNIIVTNGANQAFMNSMLTITQPGDEIIFFTPSYFNYVMAAQLTHCKPIFVSTTDTFQPDINQLESKISKKTKAIVSISPNNPTGAVYSIESIKAMNQLCQDNGIYHISDEVYEYFLYDDAIHVSPLQFDDSLSHTISLFSLSKAFSLSGLRIGYMVFPAHLLDDLLKVQDTNGICAPSPAQAAAEKIIPLGRRYCHQFFNVLKCHRRKIRSMLSELSFVQSVWTKGAYYFFMILDSDVSSWTLAKRLIEEYDVIVLPGSIFDVKKSSFRLSYGNIDEENISFGLDRLIKGLTHLI